MSGINSKNTVVPLYINSKNRHNVNDNSNNFTIKLYKSLRNISSIEVSNVVIPNVQKVINNSNNLLEFYFITDASSAFLSIEITKGDYTVSELVGAIGSKLSELFSTLNITCNTSYDIVSEIISIDLTYVNGVLYSSWGITFRYNGLLDLIGIGNLSSSEKEYKSSTEFLSIVGDRAIDLSGIRVYNITSTALNNNINTSYVKSTNKKFLVSSPNDTIYFKVGFDASNYAKNIKTEISSEISNEISKRYLGTTICASSNGNVIVAATAYGQLITYSRLIVNGLWASRDFTALVETKRGVSLTAAINSDGTWMVVGAPTYKRGGSVMIYKREKIIDNWTLDKEFDGFDISTSPMPSFNSDALLGYAVAISEDSSVVAVGAPNCTSYNGLIPGVDGYPIISTTNESDPSYGWAVGALFILKKNGTSYANSTIKSGHMANTYRLLRKNSMPTADRKGKPYRMGASISISEDGKLIACSSLSFGSSKYGINITQAYGITFRNYIDSGPKVINRSYIPAIYVDSLFPATHVWFFEYNGSTYEPMNWQEFFGVPYKKEISNPVLILAKGDESDVARSDQYHVERTFHVKLKTIDGYYTLFVLDPYGKYVAQSNPSTYKTLVWTMRLVNTMAGPTRTDSVWENVTTNILGFNNLAEKYGAAGVTDFFFQLSNDNKTLYINDTYEKEGRPFSIDVYNIETGYVFSSAYNILISNTVRFMGLSLIEGTDDYLAIGTPYANDEKGGISIYKYGQSTFELLQTKAAPTIDLIISSFIGTGTCVSKSNIYMTSIIQEFTNGYCTIQLHKFIDYVWSKTDSITFKYETMSSPLYFTGEEEEAFFSIFDTYQPMATHINAAGSYLMYAYSSMIITRWADEWFTVPNKFYYYNGDSAQITFSIPYIPIYAISNNKMVTSNSNIYGSVIVGDNTSIPFRIDAYVTISQDLYVRRPFAPVLIKASEDMTVIMVGRPYMRNQQFTPNTPETPNEGLAWFLTKIIINNPPGCGGVDFIKLDLVDGRHTVNSIENKLLAEIAPSDYKANSFVSSISVSKDGSLLFLGDANINNVYFITDTPGGYYKQQTISIPEVAPSGTEQFGASINISDDNKKMFVGAPVVDASAGAVYVFVYSDGKWDNPVKISGQAGSGMGKVMSLFDNYDFVSGSYKSDTKELYLSFCEFKDDSWTTTRLNTGSITLTETTAAEYSITSSSPLKTTIISLPNYDKETGLLVSNVYNLRLEEEFSVKLDNKYYNIYDINRVLSKALDSYNTVSLQLNTDTLKNVLSVESKHSNAVVGISSKTTLDVLTWNSLGNSLGNQVSSDIVDFSINNNIVKSVINVPQINGFIIDNVLEESYRKYPAGFTIEDGDLIDIQLRDENDVLVDTYNVDWCMTVYATIHN